MICQSRLQRLGGGQQVGGPARAGPPPIRSIGPDTETAAITAPAVAHRRRHARHPRLAFGHALRPAPSADLEPARAQ